jgi:vancomycin permeability regulator SanA
MIVHTIVITIDGLTDNHRRADCILVLGNTVHADGTISDRLKGRLDKALELYRKDLAAKIVVSGARGQEGHEEALVMKNYLAQNGVSDSVIIVDNFDGYG